MDHRYPRKNTAFGRETNPQKTNVTASEKNTITPELLVRLREGDHDAYKTVYIHYSTPLYHFLTALIRSEDEAREITQDVFVRLWEKRGRIDPRKNIRTYLYTMAKNSVMNHFEHQGVRQRYRQYQSGSEDTENASDEILIAQETEILIELAVSRMPAQRRKIFELSRKEGMSNETIARELNISKENVAAHLSYARKDIKEIIALLVLFFAIL